MNVTGKYLKDENGNIFSPITNSKNVYDDNGVSLENLITIKEGTYRIGTWIDGKPIYRKMQTTTFASTLNQWNPLFTIPDLYCLFRVHGIWNSGTSLFVSPYAGSPQARPTEIEYVSFFFNAAEGNTLFERHNYDYMNGCNHFVICEYVGLS